MPFIALDVFIALRNGASYGPITFNGHTYEDYDDLRVKIGTGETDANVVIKNKRLQQQQQQQQQQSEENGGDTPTEPLSSWICDNCSVSWHRYVRNHDARMVRNVMIYAVLGACAFSLTLMGCLLAVTGRSLWPWLIPGWFLFDFVCVTAYHVTRCTTEIGNDVAAMGACQGIAPPIWSVFRCIARRSRRTWSLLCPRHGPPPAPPHPGGIKLPPPTRTLPLAPNQMSFYECCKLAVYDICNVDNACWCCDNDGQATVCTGV
jgi:hypothetical protein